MEPYRKPISWTSDRRREEEGKGTKEKGGMCFCPIWQNLNSKCNCLPWKLMGAGRHLLQSWRSEMWPSQPQTGGLRPRVLLLGLLLVWPFALQPGTKQRGLNVCLLHALHQAQINIHKTLTCKQTHCLALVSSSAPFLASVLNAGCAGQKEGVLDLIWSSNGGSCVLIIMIFNLEIYFQPLYGKWNPNTEINFNNTTWGETESEFMNKANKDSSQSQKPKNWKVINCFFQAVFFLVSLREGLKGQWAAQTIYYFSFWAQKTLPNWKSGIFLK